MSTTLKKKASVFAGISVIALLFGLLIYRHTNAPVLAQPSANDTAKNDSPNLTGEKAVTHLKETGAYNSLAEAMTAARYKADATSEGASVNNHANNLRGTFTTTGLRLESAVKDEKWQSQWQRQ